MTRAPVRSAGEDLVFLARRADLTFRFLTALAERYAGVPPALAARQGRQCAVLRELLRRRYPEATADPVPADDAWIRDRVSVGPDAGADAVDALLADTVRVLEAALPRIADAEIRAAYHRLYADTLRQERLVRSWVRHTAA
ncbi:hypothetical protein [Actinoplanes sp. NPDC049316]|uniref:hypothetical protein n=1 Tax=Actinoplanes sp. NPDC049316 TaxID=3154727 RepID=UPI003438A603